MRSESPGKIFRVDGGTVSVLIVEQDPLMLTAIGSVLNMQGYRCVLARTEQVALHALGSDAKPDAEPDSEPAKSSQQLNQTQPTSLDLIVLSIDDLDSGCQFAGKLRSNERTQDVPIIFLVPELSMQWSERLAKQGGVFSMLKPIEPEALIDLVEKAIWIPHIVKGRLGTIHPHLKWQSDWTSLSEL